MNVQLCKNDTSYLQVKVKVEDNLIKSLFDLTDIGLL